MYIVETLKGYGESMMLSGGWNNIEFIVVVGGSLIIIVGVHRLCFRNSTYPVKEPVEDIIRKNGMVFDLDKLINNRADILGLKCRLFAWFLNSMCGYPLKKYISGQNLDPLMKVDIPEPATYHPFEPNVPTYLEHTQIIKIFDVKAQLNFLRSNRSYKEKNEFYFKSILDYYDRYSNLSTTPLILIHELKSMVERSDSETPPLRCFTQLLWEQAFKDAKDSAERYNSGKQLSVIDGVPFAVKEVFAMAGLSRNCGRAVKERPDSCDAEIVSVLRKAGAIAIGLTNMHEMGMGVTGLNIHNGSTRNPYNTDYFPGGSSSGSAAAVASGMLAFAIGSDGGGSIRIPSAMCGLVGMKPTFARYSPIGASHIDSSVTSSGAIAGCVEDVALIHAMLAKYAPSPIFFNRHISEESKLEKDWDKHLKSGEIGEREMIPTPPNMEMMPKSAGPVPAPCFSTQPFDYVTFGIPEQQMSYVHDHAIKRVFDSVLAKLHKKQDILIGELFHSKVAHFTVILGEVCQNLHIFRNFGDKLSPTTQVVYGTCGFMPFSQYSQAAKQKTRAIKFMRDIFTKVDIIISPTVAVTQRKIIKSVLKHDEICEQYLLQTQWFIFMANLCGLPAISINAGYTDEGMPIGVMLMGSWWTEDKLLAAAHKLQIQLKKPMRYYCPLDSV